MTTPTGQPQALAHVARWVQEGLARDRDALAELVLATVDPLGRPDLRIVPGRGWTTRGLLIHTDRDSAKVRDLTARPSLVTALLTWSDPRRQARIHATAIVLAAEETNVEFLRRDIASQRRAWARSGQSIPAAGPDGNYPPPPTWAAVELIATEIDLWEMSGGDVRRSSHVLTEAASVADTVPHDHR